MKSPLHAFIVGGLIGAAFLAGQLLRPPTLAAQGRGPVTPVQAEPSESDVIAERDLLALPDEQGSSAAFANGYLAVTGSYGVGTSVLYLVDTNTGQLAVYEARGGAPSMRRIVLVAARRISLDLELEGYNDESEYDYATLKRMFEAREAQAARAAQASGR